MAPRDEVADIAVSRSLDEAVVDHPEVVEHLGQVLRAVVADQSDNALGFLLLAAVLQRRRKQRSDRRARKHAFLFQQLAGGVERLLVGDRICLRNKVKMANRWNEILANALDQPRSRHDGFSLVHQRRKNRADGIRKDDLALGIALLEKLSNATHRAARADARNEGIDLAFHLRPNLGRGRVVVSLRVRLVGELAGVERVGIILGDFLGDILVVLRMTLGNIAAREHDLGAHRAQMRDLLIAHLVGHNDSQAIALLTRNQRKCETSIARGRLNNAAALLELARLLRRVDHGHRNAVLDRIAWVQRLHLDEELAWPSVDASDLEHRRVADHLEDVAKDRCSGMRRTHGSRSVQKRSASAWGNQARTRSRVKPLKFSGFRSTFPRATTRGSDQRAKSTRDRTGRFR